MSANRSLRLVLLAICYLAPVMAGAAEKQQQPNVVLILADDLGYSDLGCYGGEMSTPAIDALAAGGSRFTQLYNSARCCPSRASLMTGLYPTQAGIGDFTTSKPSPSRGPGYLGRLNDRCVTLAEVLKPAGYGCYYVGKWHLHPQVSPVSRGFDEFYGYTEGHSHDQYDASYYIRLPEGRKKEIDPPADKYYATDVFNQYAMEFIKQGQKKDKPWFLFLGHSSPHFPVQAPAERADKYEKIYQRGWDVLREERFAKMKKLGLVNDEKWKLTPRSLVPVDRSDIANGYSGKPNPAWTSLEADRRADLARRMAVFAAMVEGVDNGVAKIVEHLKKTGDYENTLILFLSDNGACYEWGPFGFDNRSRRGETILRTGDEVRNIGQRGTHQSYGSGWANLGNTPLRLYKHFTHEGGISTPFIAHWPQGIGRQKDWVRTPAHVMDILPTLADACGATYPTTFDNREVTPTEGVSLLPLMRGKKLPQREIGFDHQAAHALRDGDWKIVWGKRMPHELRWELYNIGEDRCETNDLAQHYPQRVKSMEASWKKWAARVGVTYDAPAGDNSRQRNQDKNKGGAGVMEKSPQIAGRNLTITGHVQPRSQTGVIVAQGGREHGYSVHLLEGRLTLDVRVNGQVTRLAAEKKTPVEFDFTAIITANKLSLQINGKEVASKASPGLIPVQPKDALSIGHDHQTAAGDYEAPNRLRGSITGLKVKPQAATPDANQ